MFIKYSPQVNNFENITYSFSGLIVTATYKGVTDTFDFTGMPEGELDIFTVETTLEFSPITMAKVENGVLYVELLRFYNEATATDYDRYPTDWQEV